MKSYICRENFGKEEGENV